MPVRHSEFFKLTRRGMSKPLASLPALPVDTARAAKTLLEDGYFYLIIGDHLDSLFADIALADLYAVKEIPVVHPALLTLITLFQFLEDLPDKPAADSARTRIDWKYALHLPLNYPGFDSALLNDLRERLMRRQAQQPILGHVLAHFREIGLLGDTSLQPSDAVFILEAVHAHNRLKLVMEAMRLAMEMLATCCPEWLQKIALPHWYERYSSSAQSFRFPRATEEREAQGLEIGADGFYLLQALAQRDAPELAFAMTEIKSLQQMWDHHFEKSQDSVRWGVPRDASLPMDIMKLQSRF